MNAPLMLLAIFNGAWQGAVLCALAYFFFRCVRSLNATTMFTVWSVLLAICIALPFANYAFAARPYAIRVTAPAYRVRLAQPLPGAAPVRTALVAAAAPTVRERGIALVTAAMQRAWIALALLAVIALVRLALLARDMAGMFATRRAARRIAAPVNARLAIDRPYAFASSESLTSPCVLGFVPALIVIPHELLGAPQNELLSVVLHEAEHVRRYDDVQNVLHRIIGALAFFCPGVRIALRELALYREQICDDAAVHGLGDPIAYAMTLTAMAQWAQGRGAPVPSLIFKRKQLLHRLEVLLDRAVNHSLRMNRRFAFSAGVILVLAAALVLRVQVPVIAQVLVTPQALRPLQPLHTAARMPAVHPHLPKRLPRIAPLPAIKPMPTIAPLEQQHTMHAVLARVRRIARVEALKHVQTVRATASAQRYAYAYATSYATSYAATYAQSQAPSYARSTSADMLLEALQNAGLTHLSVDDLIALRDHGVSATLVDAAHAAFDGNLTADGLIRLADRGISAEYLMRVHEKHPHAGIDEVIRLHDSGF